MRFRSALIFLIAWWGYAGTLTVGDLTLDPGDTRSLNISLVGGSQISALQFDIVVPDEQALSFGDVQRGAALGPHRMVYNGANYRTVTYSPASDVLSNGAVIAVAVSIGSQGLRPDNHAGECPRQRAQWRDGGDVSERWDDSAERGGQ